MNNIVRKLGIITMLAVMIVGGTAPIFAQTPEEVNIRTIQDILVIVRRGVDWAFTFFFVLAAFFILSAAFTYLTGGGSKESIEAAKKKIMYAALGILIALVARSIPFIIRSFLAS